MSDQAAHSISMPDQPNREVDDETNRETNSEVNALHGPFQAEQYQAGAYFGQSGSAGTPMFGSGDNRSQPAYYSDPRASMVPSIHNAHTQEQDLSRGSNGMLSMSVQKPFSPNAHYGPLYPLSNQNTFTHSPGLNPDTPSGFAQYSPHMSPRYPDPANQPPLSKLWPQSAPPLSQPSFPFWGYQFQNFGQVNVYLNEVCWFPSMDRYGFPQTSDQYKFYLEKICIALRNISKVWDLQSAPWQFSKFMPKGEWTDHRDIEAIAHTVMYTTMRIHISGVTDFAHRRSIDLISLNSEDVDFTFPQRIHFVACLLNHSKVIAAEVMARVNIEKYVALPITCLRSFHYFNDKWVEASAEERRNWTEVKPYLGSGFTHPTPEVREQLTAISLARYQQTYAGRQAREAGASALMIGNQKIVQPPAQQDAGGQRRYSTAASLEAQGSPVGAGQARGQPPTRLALSGSNEHLQGVARYRAQSFGDGGLNSPDLPDMQ
ncbi:hypothetical protein COCSADRAFT_21917 [Bipolaris sorokiniana ND90Pr]|uniref:Uncharacterized protein n=1 Tax=Cochliobolus sativus (strain ND90Pr / ATCC 201652) TaxID=665912 RepID=M2TKP7_COCSN|nr:uncharacterized protein COCSADRAFT_21917 [Bipolaris sorokiniana ND90Pr]EMD69731.1 hypothetical protein COCSADRAFT_21917 [Bipolaris sorokiniana ND90Pr]